MKGAGGTGPSQGDDVTGESVLSPSPGSLVPTSGILPPPQGDLEPSPDGLVFPPRVLPTVALI